MLNLSTLTDQKILELCQKYGEQTRLWKQKFIGLLPEVNRRKLYEKKHFSSIFEFAAKLAGMSEEQVRLALNLEKKLDNKPVLKNLFTNGEVSINKLARVTSVVTQENEKFWANQVQLLPQKALEVLVRDERIHQNDTTDKFESHLETDSHAESKNGLQDGLFDNESLRAQILAQQKVSESNLATIEDLEKLQLTNKITKRLVGFKQKGFDLNQLLEELLDKREAEIEDEKEEIAQAMEFERSSADKTVTRGTPISRRIGKHLGSSAYLSEQAPDGSALTYMTHSQTSRYIPLKIRRLVTKEHGNKCSIPTCHNPSETLHHSQRFALAHFHDPRYLAPLCKEHHLIAHSIDVKFQKKRRPAVSIFSF